VRRLAAESPLAETLGGLVALCRTDLRSCVANDQLCPNGSRTVVTQLFLFIVYALIILRRLVDAGRQVARIGKLRACGNA
jgi:hypothetical protein